MSEVAAGLIDYLNASPSPFHACQTSATLLAEAGFTLVDEAAAWPNTPGRYYLIRGGSLIAWNTESAAGPTTPMRVIGAHTDSPNLRIKPRPDWANAGWQMLGVEVYGGALLSSWLDRDLGLSGRAVVRRNGETRCELFRIDEPVLRVSRLAIHLDRTVSSESERLNPQSHLAPHWGLGRQPGDFLAYLAEHLSAASSDVLGWEAMTHDLTPASIFGKDKDLIAGGRMDNLATSYAGTRALIAAAAQPAAAPLTQVLALFDHEEIGSVSGSGAASELLTTTLERITLSLNGTRGDLHRSIAASVVASGDMAHATHPNYADRHEPQHRILMNGGPVLKTNVNGRYATDALGAAHFRVACAEAGVPVQDFVTRSDLPCGSTVGPVTAALTGATVIDFGAPTLSMHSARELVGVADQEMYLAALTAFLAPV